MLENNVKVASDKDILKIGLVDNNDKPILDEKGEVVCWEFDLSDIELSIKYNQIVVRDKQLRQSLKMKLVAIDKKQDVKGQGFMTRNEEEKARAIVDFYKEDMKILDTFLGQNGTKKFLSGRKPYIDMFYDIEKALEPILPLFEKSFENISDRIKSKYSSKEENVIE